MLARGTHVESFILGSAGRALSSEREPEFCIVLSRRRVLEIKGLARLERDRLSAPNGGATVTCGIDSAHDARFWTSAGETSEVSRREKSTSGLELVRSLRFVSSGFSLLLRLSRSPDNSEKAAHGHPPSEHQ